MTDRTAALRIDKWLWQARFFKTRSLAAKVVTSGHVRLNGTRVSKTSASVKPGDVLTFPQARRIRVVTVLEIGMRRGPAVEAQLLYEDRSPQPAPPALKSPAFDRGGRPTKKDRRSLQKLERDPT